MQYPVQYILGKYQNDPVNYNVFNFKQPELVTEIQQEKSCGFSRQVNEKGKCHQVNIIPGVSPGIMFFIMCVTYVHLHQ